MGKEYHRRTMSGAEALARARSAAAGPGRGVITGRPADAKTMLALRWWREVDRHQVEDPQAEPEERAARRVIALLDLDRCTRDDWANLTAAHEQVRHARLALHRGDGTAVELRAAWRLVGVVAGTLPKI